MSITLTGLIICTQVYLDGARRPQIFPSESLLKPNPSCAICRNTHVSLKINTKTTTLRAFLETIVQRQDDQMDTEEDVVIANARSNEYVTIDSLIFLRLKWAVIYSVTYCLFFFHNR